MTMIVTDVCATVVAHDGVYAPQADSRLLIKAMRDTGVASGRRVLDLCTGSGVVAVAAALEGAAAVTAFDICPRAVRCARGNATAHECTVDVRLGGTMHAVSAGPFDLVLCNPPYVPAATDQGTERVPPSVGPATAWDAGDDGRELLDALCERSSDLLYDGGTMLVVQSEFAGIDETACALRCAGLDAGVIASRLIPFGPVMSARAAWLEETGRLAPGRREERIAVIRADKR